MCVKHTNGKTSHHACRFCLILEPRRLNVACRCRADSSRREQGPHMPVCCSVCAAMSVVSAAAHRVVPDEPHSRMHVPPGHICLTTTNLHTGHTTERCHSNKAANLQPSRTTQLSHLCKHAHTQEKVIEMEREAYRERAYTHTHTHTHEPIGVSLQTYQGLVVSWRHCTETHTCCIGDFKTDAYGSIQ